MQETQVQSQAWEGALEEELATCSSIVAWKSPWTEEPSGFKSMGLQKVWHNEEVILIPEWQEHKNGEQWLNALSRGGEVTEKVRGIKGGADLLEPYRPL